MSDKIVYSQKGPASWPEMSGPALDERLKTTRVVLLPFGATEAHGAHLPLGTDTYEARENCRRAAIRLETRGCPVIIGPEIPFGTSSFHMGFTGTISITSRTLITLTNEICMSMYQSGVRKFAFIHGHDGNLPSMMVAAQEVVDGTPDAEVMVLNWLTPLSKIYHTIQTSKKGEGHGGEGETSRILVTHPELVHLDQSVRHHLDPDVMHKIQGPDHIKTGGGVFYATRSYKTHTPYGHIGDPALAAEVTGNRGYDVIAEWLSRVIARDYFGQTVDMSAPYEDGTPQNG